MANYIISCSAPVDISAEHLKNIDVQYLKFHYSLDGKEMLDDLGQSMSADDFYTAMKNGADTKTSQIPVGEYIDYFTPLLAAGNDIIHIELSSGISGSYRSAVNAQKTLAEEFPERKLIIVDSLAASAGFGLLVDYAASKRAEGLSIDELNEWLIENRLKLHHWFFSTDLTFFVKGGRVSKAAGFVGGVLNICPLLFVDKEGKLIPHSKIRTKKRVIEAIVDKMAEYADNGTEYSGKCYISNSMCREDADAVASLIKARFPKVDDVLINNIGTTIGSHTGPGTVALFFMGSDRAGIVMP